MQMEIQRINKIIPTPPSPALMIGKGGTPRFSTSLSSDGAAIVVPAIVAPGSHTGLATQG